MYTDDENKKNMAEEEMATVHDGGGDVPEDKEVPKYPLLLIY